MPSIGGNSLKNPYNNILDFVNSSQLEHDESVLMYTIENFCNKLDDSIDESFVMKKLKSNGFQSLYLVSNKYWDLNNISGFYCLDSRSIFINKNKFEEDKELGSHELYHALLHDHLFESINNWNRIISEDSSGWEEALAYDLEFLGSNGQINYNLVNSSKINSSFRLILFLNCMYQYYSGKKYNNIFTESLVNPNDFLFLIYNIYNEAIAREAQEEDDI